MSDKMNEIFDKLLQARQNGCLESVEIYAEMLAHEAKVLQAERDATAEGVASRSSPSTSDGQSPRSKTPEENEGVRPAC